MGKLHTRVLMLIILCAIVLHFFVKSTMNPETIDNGADHVDMDQAFYVTSDNMNISIPLAKSLLNGHQQLSQKDVIQLSPNITKSPSTIVTAYFRIPSKHSSTTYDSWMQNLLSLKDHMIIFTQPDRVGQMKEYRSHAMDRTIIISLNLDDTPISKLFPKIFWEDQLMRDPEQTIHQSYQLFWVWLSKSWFTVTAIQYNFFQSNLFMWSDIGCFRDKRYNSQKLILHRELVPHDEMLMMAFKEPNPPEGDVIFYDKEKYKENFFHSGSQMVGYKNTWKKFYEHFLSMIDNFLDRNMLLVDDQVILQCVCLSHPEVCAYVLPSEVDDRRFHGLRYVLHYGGEYTYWRYRKPIPS